MKYITRNVWILSFISLFNDLATEMLYPIMPLYLKSIGFSIIYIGILEGFVEAVAGLSKAYFGKVSDQLGMRVRFVQIGYTLSALSKPMIVLFSYPAWVFFSRTVERLGKGLRTASRDALLSAEATIKTKAKVFGFHRSMDTFGAVFGPLIALSFLSFYPQNYRLLFFMAFIPGIVAVLFSLFIKENNISQIAKANTDNIYERISFFSFLSYWSESNPAYKKLIIGLLGFAILNSSDVFLLLKMKSSGMEDTQVILIYIFYNIVYSLTAFPIGILADKIGIKKVFVGGLICFCLAYSGISLFNNWFGFFLFFFIYGIYAAATEGISKAWISNMVATDKVATAIGFYTGFQSIAALIASSVTGIIWYLFSAKAALLYSAIASLGVIFYFTFFVPMKRETETIQLG